MKEYRINRRGLFIIAPALLLLLVHLLFVIPQKGFDLTDHGYLLYSSYILSHGIIPAEGIGYIFNSIFMWLGVFNYLFYERLLVVLQLSSVVFFYFSLQQVRATAHILSILLISIVVLGLNVVYIISYQNAPQIFILLGLGVFFYCFNQNEVKVWHKLGYVIAAVLLAGAAVANISLLPTAVTTLVLLAWLLRRSSGSLLFYLSYCLCLFVGFLLYAHSPLSILQHKAGFSGGVPSHAGGLSIFIMQIPEVLRTVFAGGLFYLIPIILLLRLFKDKIGLVSIERWLPFLFLASVLVMYANMYSLFVSASPVYRIPYLQIAQFKTLLLATICFYDHNNLTSRKLFVSALIVLLASLALATTSSVLSHLGLLGGACLLVASMMYFHALDLRGLTYSNVLTYTYVCLLAIVAILSAVFFVSFTYRSAQPLDKKVRVSLGVMNGVYAGEAQERFLQEVNKLYVDNNCQDKKLLAYAALPLLYYVYQRTPPAQQSWIGGGPLEMSSVSLGKYLSHAKHWCVFIAPHFNTGLPTGYNKFIYKYLDAHAQSHKEFKHLTQSSYSPKEFAFYSR